MKNGLLALVLFSSLNAFATEVIVAPVDHVFVPEGFDNNDSVEVVVTGTFSNTCYSRNQVQVKVVDETIKISIDALNNTKKSKNCAEILVPFKEVVSIGNLQGGNYTIVVNEKSRYELKDQLKIAAASTNNVDDHIYALVEYIDLGFVESGDAMLVGWNPSDCLELDHVEYISNKKDTLSILPVMKKVSDFCPMKMTPIHIPIKYDRNAFNSDKILLYTRTIEGKSVSTLVNLKQ